MGDPRPRAATVVTTAVGGQRDMSSHVCRTRWEREGAAAKVAGNIGGGIRAGGSGAEGTQQERSFVDFVDCARDAEIKHCVFFFLVRRIPRVREQHCQQMYHLDERCGWRKR